MKRNSSITAYTVGHLLVDFACGYILYYMYTQETIEVIEVGGIFVLYNLLAFATQFIFGIAADKFASNGRFFATCGCIVTALGLFFGDTSPYLTVTLVGIGNAMFHVGGGIDALTRSNGMTRAGIFVSSGSLGVALGCFAGTKEWIKTYHLIAVLLFVAAVVWIYCSGKRELHDMSNDEIYDGAQPFSKRVLINSAAPAIVVLLAAIFLRSWVGSIALSPESDSSIAFLLPAVAAFGGKYNIK